MIKDLTKTELQLILAMCSELIRESENEKLKAHASSIFDKVDEELKIWKMVS